MPEGVIVKGIGGFYYVQTDDTLFECKPKGLMRIGNETPLPGDKVYFDILDNETNKGTITELFTRTSLLSRPAVANLTQLLIVVPCAQPEPDLFLADKLIISAYQHKIRPILVFNKIDLLSEVINKYAAQYSSSGIQCVLVSTLTGEGIADLLKRMQNEISCFAGQSGVGKSSILNAIMEHVVMPTGIVSEKNSRGKHTTRHAELFALKGKGFVLDTPGFSSYELDDIKFDELWEYYPEMNDINERCKFKGCLHISEPDCRVKDKLARGEITSQRYERYTQIVIMLKEKYNNRWR